MKSIISPARRHRFINQHDPIQTIQTSVLGTMNMLGLDWQPKVQLEEGLRSTIAYFHELLSEPAAAAPFNAA